MRWLGGTGEWLTLFRCSAPWRYRLFSDRLDADACRGKVCGPNCKGTDEHKTWRVISDEEIAARDEAKNRTKTEPTKVDDATLTFWETKLGVDGI